MEEFNNNSFEKNITGQVYIWTPDPSLPLGGTLNKSIVRLPDLEINESGEKILSNQFVEVNNAGVINLPENEDSSIIATPMGNAQPDAEGNFIFEPFNGGGRMDKELLVDELRRFKNIQAARFGEVNTFYHIHQIASYVNELLGELGERQLPQVKVLINAHGATASHTQERDGYRGHYSGKWLPFQGGHYRLSTKNLTEIIEPEDISTKGEIHLGPGWQLTEDGALTIVADCRYRCNASHNAGIIYHEYGHHINRYTADFVANRLIAPHLQSNRKTALDEAICDYWAATMLNCPHIWALHRKHTDTEIHIRSLASSKTMKDYDWSKNADPHLNGTIFASCLWDIRNELCNLYPDGGKKMDLMVLRFLINTGQIFDSAYNPTKTGTRKLREGFSLGLSILLEADENCYKGIHKKILKSIFLKRGISPATNYKMEYKVVAGENNSRKEIEKSILHIRDKDPEAIIPEDKELLSGYELEEKLITNNAGPFSLTAVGDIMLGSRMNKQINKNGYEFTFHSVYPILKRTNIILGNLEGPFAKKAIKRERNYCYKVNPRKAIILRRAGFNVMSLANNHLLDCDRQGVVETIDALEKQQIKYIGAGRNKDSAHNPTIMRSGKLKIGLLAYYWNKRTSAKDKLPGSAMDTKEKLEQDIRHLRMMADRIVINFHWGIPYEREPSVKDQEKAKFAIDCGADMIIGHHPHIIQPFQIYKNRPIFYSIGNFAFGSANSKAESIILSTNFLDAFTTVTIFPAYIKNRDARINYQPKVLTGNAAEVHLNKLKKISGKDGAKIQIKNEIGIVKLPFDIR